MEEVFDPNFDFEGQKYKLEILDTPGNEQLILNMDSLISSSEGFLLVFAINDKESFTWLKGKHDLILKGKQETKCPILLVGNKQDLENYRQVTYDDAKAQADSWGIEYIETSAITGLNCKEAFEKLVKKIVKANSNCCGCPCCNIM